MPKVSIIVTSYNIENYIRESLDSIIGQSLRDIEIIIVDDGSTDNTAQIIMEYAAQDPRIKPIIFENNTIGGVASAANAGLEVALGDYIGFADGDDVYDLEMFEKMWDSAEDAQADLAMCRYTLLDETDGKEKEPAETDRWVPFASTTVIDLDATSRKQMLRFISVPWRKLYRRDLVEKMQLRFPVGDFFYEDNPFHWDSIIGAKRIVLLPEKLCKHRVARIGQTMATIDERLLRIFEHHDIIRDHLNTHHVLDIYKNELLRWVAAQLSWVSQRAEGNMRPLLYERLLPIIGQYSTNEISEFATIYGHGRSTQMLQGLKNRSYQKFSLAAGWSEKKGKKSHEVKGSSIFARGLYHLRTSGPRTTASMTIHYISNKIRPKDKIQSARSPQKREPIDNADLMAAMVVLQREVREVRKDIKKIKVE